jgi:putative acetyltransferase
MTSGLVLRVAAWDDPAGAALRAAQKAEVDAMYGGDTEPGPKPTASSVTVFFVAEVDGAPVGCGGLRQLDAEHGEIKRMYVAPPARGTGVSAALLRALEQEARDRGWRRVVLETGVEQRAAIRLYEREGYTRIPNFGYYADSALSLCYELVLEE